MPGAYAFKLYHPDGTFYQDLNPRAYSVVGSYRLSRPTSWTLQVPAAESSNVRKGMRVRTFRNDEIVANDIVMVARRDGDKNTAWCKLTTGDPMTWWEFRPLRDETGDFSRPVFTPVEIATLGTSPANASIPTYRPISGAEMIRRAIDASQFWEGTLWLDTTSGIFDESVPPAVDLGIDDLTNWPIKISDMASGCINTGMVDVWVDPLDDFDPMGILNVKIQRGTDRSSSVHFDYATGNKYVDTIQHTQDLSTICNRLWYYLGPPQGVQRYKANITGTSPGFADPPKSDLEDLIAASRAFYGVAMDVRIYDQGNEYLAMPAFKRLWQRETLLRVNGQELLSIVPHKEAGYKPFDDFNVGDIIGVNGTADALGVDLDGAQRIYGFDIAVDGEGNEQVTQLVVSADQEI